MGTPKGTKPWNYGTSKGWTDKRGYRWLYVTENGRRRARREHRVIMERHLDRRLEPWEAVHHIDGDPTNNTLENLEVVEFGKHSSNHHFGNQRPDTAKRTMAVLAQMREEIKHLRVVNAELLEALENCLSLVELKFDDTDATGDAVMKQARAAIAAAQPDKVPA